MLFKKKKSLPRIVPGTERTEDTRPFFIPRISKLEDKETMKKKFVSPIFGMSVKDEIVVPNDRKYYGDIDKKYDAFRKKKNSPRKKPRNVTAVRIMNFLPSITKICRASISAIFRQTNC